MFEQLLRLLVLRADVDGLHDAPADVGGRHARVYPDSPAHPFRGHRFRLLRGGGRHHDHLHDFGFSIRV